MKYEIRPSTKADGDTLLSIWRSSVADTHSFVSRDDMAAIDLDVQRFLPGSSVLLALDEDGRPAGFMGLADHAIESLFIAGAHRGRGAGRALVEHAMRQSLSLTTIVNEENHQAVGFYRHMGFQAVGRSPTDEDGRPYPVLHMLWIADPEAEAEDHHEAPNSLSEGSDSRLEDEIAERLLARAQKLKKLDDDIRSDADQADDTDRRS